jgi:putative peptide zinc metalloprotease protein
LTTLAFNANPLIRLDGYYVLSDLIEIPNLSQRASQYLGYLARRYGLGLRDAVSPVTAAGERVWFVGYALASFLYRTVVTFAIALFLASKMFLLGSLSRFGRSWASLFDRFCGRRPISSGAPS